MMYATFNSEYSLSYSKLFENVVPKTAQNFKRLLLSAGSYQGRVLSLLNNQVHSYMPRAYIELGHLSGGNCSIYGPSFRDESFQLLHDKAGLLTSISEENTNNSRFAITLAPCSFMDYKNTVFGQVTAESIEELKRLERLGKGIMNLKIKNTQQIPVQVQAHSHH